MTWNAANLTWGKTKELSLIHLLASNKVDIAVITETELDVSTGQSFKIQDYSTFLPTPSPGGKFRLIILIKTSLTVAYAVKVRSDLNTEPGVSLWLELNFPTGQNLLLGGVYRPWMGLVEERSHVDDLASKILHAASLSKSVLITGDFNLDALRAHDPTYARRGLLKTLWNALEGTGVDYISTAPTYFSHGTYNGARRSSCIDHVYVAGLTTTVTVLPEASTDHRPVLVNLSCANNNVKSPLTEICRRNFKKLTSQKLNAALELWDWASIYKIHNVESVHDYLTRGIISALDMVAPVQSCRVRRGANTYLSTETITAMKQRDAASHTHDYKKLRNKVTSLVRRDKLKSNLDRLAKAKGDPKALWNLANEALGKSTASPLPATLELDGVETAGDLEAATALNNFYISKIDKLREGIPKSVAVSSESLPVGKPAFSFSFANAGRIANIVKKMSTTTALGNDGIPTRVLKLGVDTLAGPISHLVNRSLANATVPSAFKKARIIPIFKGKGKQANDPASYRPVSLLPAMSKVLEVVVKQDLERHLNAVGGLPNSQFGFRPGRSTTTAISSAHGKWMDLKQRGKITGIMAFNFSAAFDTVDGCTLLKKLGRLGITGKPADWFRSYMEGGEQAVIWRDAVSPPNSVKYGVRQGSILGPLLFITLMSDLPDNIGAGEDIVGYADDVTIWASGHCIDQVKKTLEDRAKLFVEYASANALVLNPSKTQLLLVGKVNAEQRAGFSINVGTSTITPSPCLDLLGVKIDTNLSFDSYLKDTARAARARAAMIRRLTYYLPRGPYLSQLATGILMGKVGYAAPAVAPIRLSEHDPRSGAIDDIQVSINAVARSLTGRKLTDHIPVGSLLKEAHIPSYNQMSVKALAIETWKAASVMHQESKTENPLKKLILNPSVVRNRITRSAIKGLICPSLPVAANTMSYNACLVWNCSEKLRQAKSIHAAKRAAQDLCNSCPI